MVHISCMIIKFTCILFRCFLSAGSPAQSPKKSRVVEVVCSLLLEKYPTAHRSAGSYRSRWKLVVSEYNAIKSRLANSTVQDIALYSINETTLKKWFQERLRMLLLGRPLPKCSTDALLPAQKIDKTNISNHLTLMSLMSLTGRFVNIRKNARQTNIPPITHPATTSILTATNRSAIRSTTTSSTTEPPTTQPTAQQHWTQVPAPQVTVEVATQPGPSMTTMWRQRKKESEPKSRKVYSCRMCGMPMSDPSHTQFRRARYCPQTFPDVSKEQWLEQQRAKAAAKKK